MIDGMFLDGLGRGGGRMQEVSGWWQKGLGGGLMREKRVARGYLVFRLRSWLMGFLEAVGVIDHAGLRSQLRGVECFSYDFLKLQ